MRQKLKTICINLLIITIPIIFIGASILEQYNERTVFEIVDNVIERDEWHEANNSDSKQIMIDVK